MRNLKYLALLFFFISCKKEDSNLKKTEYKTSRIDSLNSIMEVENFIHSLDTNLINYNLNKTHSYCKGDFDQNGLTDLFVIGKFHESREKPFAFMNYGKDSINTIQIEDVGKYLVPKVIRENNIDFLIVSRDYHFEKRTDKLIFKYGGFINYNSKPKKYQIQKIVFTGFDIRGEYEISIDNKLNATFKNTKGEYIYNGNRKLSKGEYDGIVNLLNYMDFPNLKDDYFTMGVSDSPMCELKIIYNNGKSKNIFDSGMENNFSLKNLYAKLESLKKTVKLNTAGNSGLAQ